MRRVILMGLLLLAAGCGVSGRSATGAPRDAGVQANTLHCTMVLVGGKPQRVCGPRGKAPGETPTPPTDTARATR
jgi:hypothetical protein